MGSRYQNTTHTDVGCISVTVVACVWPCLVCDSNMSLGLGLLYFFHTRPLFFIMPRSEYSSFMVHNEIIILCVDTILNNDVGRTT